MTVSQVKNGIIVLLLTALALTVAGTVLSLVDYGVIG